MHPSELLSSQSPQVELALKALAKPAGQLKPRNRADSIRETVGFDADRISTTVVPRHELSPDLEARVLGSYRAGELVHDIAEALGIHRTTIYRIVNEAEQKLRRSTPRMDPALRARACELYQQGLPLAKVSARIGVPPTTIKRALLATGVQLRPRYVHRAE